MQETSFSFSVKDRFFGRYQRLIKDVVIPYQLRILNDEIEGAEKSHALENFRLAAEKRKTGACSGEFYGMVFQDSDVAKWLEAAAYSLKLFPDAALEAKCDEIIELIGSAQHPDGYLNTYFTVKAPEKRWTNLCEAHELYCAGHMMEAAVAYAECTGKETLLQIMCRMADHIYQHFIIQKHEGCPGHPEVELALMRLYRYTKNPHYLELAAHFINTRGTDPDYYRREREACGWSVWGGNPSDMTYNQAHAPVREQTDAVGHAVRAVYLYTGMADVALETGDRTLAAACERLFQSIVQKRMYLTGGIGSVYEGEAFGGDYHLPNDTAYSETCASVGLIFFMNRMLKLTPDSRYGDVMERALYNCVLAGIQLDGKRFFYVNPLEVVPGLSGVTASERHVLPERPGWYACACCPPNAARLLGSLPEYVADRRDDTIYFHLHIGGELTCEDGMIRVETAYPYDGTVTYRFAPKNGAMHCRLALRIPAFSKKTGLVLNGRPACYTVSDGYALIEGDFTAGDTLTLTLDLSPRKIYASPAVSADTGKAAAACGPLVYCAEGVDNAGDVLSLKFTKAGGLTVSEYDPETLCGIRRITADGLRTKKTDALYSDERPAAEPCRITMIPYYAWGNRGLNQMRVWLPED